VGSDATDPRLKPLIGSWEGREERACVRSVAATKLLRRFKKTIGEVKDDN